MGVLGAQGRRVPQAVATHLDALPGGAGEEIEAPQRVTDEPLPALCGENTPVGGRRVQRSRPLGPFLLERAQLSRQPVCPDPDWSLKSTEVKGTMATSPSCSSETCPGPPGTDIAIWGHRSLWH